MNQIILIYDLRALQMDFFPAVIARYFNFRKHREDAVGWTMAIAEIHMEFAALGLN